MGWRPDDGAPCFHSEVLHAVFWDLYPRKYHISQRDTVFSPAQLSPSKAIYLATWSNTQNPALEIRALRKHDPYNDVISL